ncbi:MAG: DNA internalization-related competence protein ComEC/Rec2 [Gammaproteobacteria bacterium]|nr:DNA internalization-related competence protein ComEC/Rec2 [Gammaproteobacteria bacterium]
MYWQLDHRLITEFNNKRLLAVGEVINIPNHTTYGSHFEFSPETLQGYPGRLPRTVKLSWRNAPADLQPGQVWRLQLRLKQPHGFQNPGGFDYERWMFARGIDATGYVIKSELNSLLETRSGLNPVRFKLQRHLVNSCPDCVYQGLMQALAIGYRGSIDDDIRRLLNQTGTAHLIAVSGLHIGIVAGVFYLAGLWFWNRLLYPTVFKRREFALLLGWFAGLAYSLLAGFELPAQRAMLMLSLVLLSLLLRVPFNLLHGVWLALLGVLLLAPLSVLSESFWLTFAALMVILLGSFLLQRERSRLKQMVLIQLLFSLLFIPLSIVIFGQIHSASMAANLVAVPLVSFVIVPLNFLLLLLFWLPQHWLEVLYGGLDRLIGLLINFLQMLQQNGLQAIDIAHADGWKIAVLLLMLLLLLIPRGLIATRLGVLALMPVLLLQLRPLPGIPLQLTVLDVGMGTAIVVQTAEHSLVYDFGPGNRNGYSLGEWVVMPFLRYQGLAAPDRIVISHADQDHAGGYYALQPRFKDMPVYTGTRSELSRKFPQVKQLYDCHQSASWKWDGVQFEFLTAPFAPTASENNRSCVLKISHAAGSMLIAGDIEQLQEEALLEQNKEALRADYLIAPHHGSLSSSSAAFIEAVSASSVIFTSGYLNRWQFPKSAVVKRYTDTGSQLSQTDRAGAIQISCAQEGCELTRYRQQHPRIWY